MVCDGIECNEGSSFLFLSSLHILRHILNCFLMLALYRGVLSVKYNFSRNMHFETSINLSDLIYEGSIQTINFGLKGFHGLISLRTFKVRSHSMVQIAT